MPHLDQFGSHEGNENMDSSPFEIFRQLAQKQEHELKTALTQQEKRRLEELALKEGQVCFSILKRFLFNDRQKNSRRNLRNWRKTFCTTMKSYGIGTRS